MAQQFADGREVILQQQQQESEEKENPRMPLNGRAGAGADSAYPQTLLPESAEHFSNEPIAAPAAAAAADSGGGAAAASRRQSPHLRAEDGGGGRMPADSNGERGGSVDDCRIIGPNRAAATAPPPPPKDRGDAITAARSSSGRRTVEEMPKQRSATRLDVEGGDSGDNAAASRADSREMARPVSDAASSSRDDVQVVERKLPQSAMSPESASSSARESGGTGAGENAPAHRAAAEEDDGGGGGGPSIPDSLYPHPNQRLPSPSASSSASSSPDRPDPPGSGGGGNPNSSDPAARGLGNSDTSKQTTTTAAATEGPPSFSTDGSGGGGAASAGGQGEEGGGGKAPPPSGSAGVDANAVGRDDQTMLQRTCLNPNYSLRNQLYLSFGVVSAVALCFVVIVAIMCTTLAGNQIKSTSRQNLESWAKLQIGHSSREISETLSKKFDNFDGLASIMMEAAQDRFVGYPDHAGYEDDSNVPFFDVTTQRNIYPLNSSPLPLDWQIVPNVDASSSSQEEHLQIRSSWYESDEAGTILVSTAGATFRMQGQCDPNVTDASAKSYYPNCTDANNDVTTGGAVRPTRTTYQIARKAADLNFVLKPLYEYYQDARTLGFFFANSGAGSVAAFPHEERDGTSSYTSGGCDWMDVPNPRNGTRKLASEEDISRCHREGERVPGREYNPLERGWCKMQALDPDKTQNVGPYLDAFKDGLWLMTFGRAVYDRVTNEFIACTLADVGVDRIAEMIEDVRIGETSEIALVRWDDKGTVVAAPNWDSSSATTTTTVVNEDLGLGVDQATFEEIKAMVDFSQPWDPKEVREKFEKTLFKREGKIVSTYPILLPKEYNEEYYPEFMVISSIDQEEVFEAVNKMDDAMSESVTLLIRDTLIVGFVGMGVIVIVIYFVGLYLTKPLQGMNRIGDQIVDTIGDRGESSNQAIDYTRSEVFWCSPRTEISDLASEFQKMVHNFSGKGTAKIVKQKFTEMKNPFTLFDEFRDLYQSRDDEFFPYKYSSTPSEMESRSASYPFDQNFNETNVGRGGLQQLPHRIHFGPNIQSTDGDAQADSTSQISLDRDKPKPVLSSPLFRWVVASIMTPLLLTMIMISALVTWEISQLFPDLVSDVQDAFIALETKALPVTATLRARFAEEVMEQAIRDLHTLSRVAGWLLFGALERSNAYAGVHAGSETCKTYPPDGSCPVMLDPLESPCDCEWKDGWGIECRVYGNGADSSRYLQKPFFEGLSQDIWPNGDRNWTSFPLVADTAETTEWWFDPTDVPGSYKGPSAAGYETTYDRLRVISALSVIQVPLYNYGASGNSGRPLASYIGFEADGMFTGFAGCKHTHNQYAHWKSSESNGAADLRPLLCPLGKHGYDPRCRGWYDTGKKTAEEGGNPLHVTAPYPFASGTTAQSSTLPLVDPKTGEHVGQTLVDFLPEAIIESLLPENTPLAEGGFPILITTQANNFGADTVVGPGYSLDSQGYPIGDLVLPYDCSDVDDPSCSNRRRFEAIVEDMRAGEADSTVFERTTPTGQIEQVFFSYAPVYSLNFDPKDSSDFSRGVDAYNSLVFSLAVAEPAPGLLGPFQQNIDVRQSVNTALAILLTLIIFAAILVIYFSSRVTVSITVPITRLLSLLQSINRSDIKDDLPQLHGGSREVSKVYGTFERLYKVVRFANAAFFSGDLDRAYSVLVDALALFIQLDNKKAIAVANNNLGITMLTMYRTMKSLGEETICGMSVEEVVAKGTSYFNDAIELGEEALDRINEEEGWSKKYLVFMQQLSNRYFNRAMFLLTVCIDHKAPDEAERQGVKDLTATRELDTEVADNGARDSFVDDESARFYLVLGRIRGLLIMMGMSYPDDWGIEELFEEAVSELSDAIQNPDHALFRDIAPAGMMQQLDVDLIEYVESDSNGIVLAARIGIRMLVEDEYVLPDAAQKAIESLLHYLDFAEGAGIPNVASDETKLLLSKYRAMLAHAIESIESPEKEDARKHSNMRQSIRGDVTMEVF